MRLTSFRLLILLLGTITITGCSILKKEDPEVRVRAFLAGFQSGLLKPDNEILTKFRVKQSPDAIQSVISVLKNKDPLIVCEVAFDKAFIRFEEDVVKVNLPVNFRVNESNSDDVESFTLHLLLVPTDQSFHITEIDGEEFYRAFNSIKNRNEWVAEQKLAMQKRHEIYENARILEAQFDSVIWYASYNQQLYFYVVDSAWTNYFLSYRTRSKKNIGTRMGLVDAKGEVVIPIEYDLIGTIGFEEPGLVEVKREGKVGYFHVEKRELVVPPVFDAILPYRKDSVLAIVKQDTLYGWLDIGYNFTVGFPSEESKSHVADFGYLKKQIRLKPDNYVFCEIPSSDQTGNGIIVPPSYLSKNGLFYEIEAGISTTESPINGWTDYKESSGTFLERITGGIQAIVTTITERYLEGREEFYTSSTLVFLNQYQDTLQVSKHFGSEVSMQMIDSTLLEVRTPRDYWFLENDASEEENLYHHTYFKVQDSTAITPLTSNRLFSQTQFVRLDSSYLEGYFIFFNQDTRRNETATFLSKKTLTFMRDEILASYGYRFPDEKRVEHFKQIGNWYDPRNEKIEDFEAEMTSIDLYNLAFLNKILESLKEPLT